MVHLRRGDKQRHNCDHIWVNDFATSCYEQFVKLPSASTLQKIT